MPTAFAKYEGAGNDFILIDNRNGIFVPDGGTIARLCDRHFGIGADGLMTLGPAEGCDCAMRYFNADGSEGEMCGNGARCFALFAHHLGIAKDRIRFVAVDGPHTARLCHADAAKGVIELEMTAIEAIEELDEGVSLDTGVPHYVEFVPCVERVDLLGRGRMLRYDTRRFPRGTNVDFVEIEGPGRLRMRTYERGVENETLACGTGAVAAAIAANYCHRHDTSAYEVAVPGGLLQVRFSHEPGTRNYTDIRLTGPARRVFTGAFDSENF